LVVRRAAAVSLVHPEKHRLCRSFASESKSIISTTYGLSRVLSTRHSFAYRESMDQWGGLDPNHPRCAVRARVARTVDSATPPAAPAYVYAATDFGPRSAEERDLCAKADHPDWLYLGGLVALNAASWYLDSQVLKHGSESSAVRLIGAGTAGLTWGAFITGAYLSLPKCEPNWVSSHRSRLRSQPSRLLLRPFLSLSKSVRSPATGP
jgi:hypothetical protein